MCLENHSEDLTLDISQDTNDLKVKKKQKKTKLHQPSNTFSTYFVVHVAGHQRRVDSGVTPRVRLHAVSTLSSQAGC